MKKLLFLRKSVIYSSFWILFAVCFVAMVVSIVFLVEEGMSKESVFLNTVNKDIADAIEADPVNFPKFPQLVICRDPGYRTDFNNSYTELVGYAYLGLGFPFRPFTADNLASRVHRLIHIFNRNYDEEFPKSAAFNHKLRELEKEYEAMKSSIKNFNIKQFIIDHSVKCEDMFITCMASLYHVDCCKSFRPYLTPVGVCYAMRNDPQVLRLVRDLHFPFPVIVHLKSPQHRDQDFEEGFHVYLGDPFVDYPLTDVSTGRKVVPGLSTTIRAKLIKTERNAKYTLWHGFGDVCPKLNHDVSVLLNRTTSLERYNMLECQVAFIQLLIRKKCSCEPLPYTFNGTKRICDPRDQYECALRSFMKKNLTDMSKECLEPCVSFTYHSEATYMKIGGRNHTRIELVYNTKQYVSHEYRKTTLSSLFSQVGGVLGLWLGASLISVVELITFIISYIRFKILPHRMQLKIKK